MSCLSGMWRVYSPDTQGRVAPEGEGLCTSHILISHDIIDLCHVFSNGIGFLCMRISKNRILEYYNDCLMQPPAIQYPVVADHRSTSSDTLPLFPLI